MRFYANENSILSGKRGAMAIEMLQNVIQSEGCLLRGHPRKGDRPRPHEVTTAFRAGYLDEGYAALLQELLHPHSGLPREPRQEPKKKKFRTFTKKSGKIVEVTPPLTVAQAVRAIPQFEPLKETPERNNLRGSAIFRLESLSLRWDKMTMEELLLAEKELSYRADLGFSLPAIIDHEAIKEYIRRRNEQS